MDPLWLRFRTLEDAQRAVDAYKKGDPMPPEIHIWPFIEFDGVIVRNPEYRDAPYEFRPAFQPGDPFFVRHAHPLVALCADRPTIALG